MPTALRTLVTPGGCWINCGVKMDSSRCSNRFRESAAYRRSGFMVSLESTRSRSGQMTDGLAIPWESKKLIGVTSSAVRGSGITMHQPHRFLKFRIA